MAGLRHILRCIALGTPFFLPAAAGAGEQPEGAFSERLEGLSAAGGVGLPGISSASGGLPWQLRTALWLGGFTQSDYLISGDRNGLFHGGLQFDVGLGRYVEAWLLVGASANKNDRVEANRLDPPLILSLGDVTLGLKGHLGRRGLHLGLQPLLSIRSSSGSVGSDYATASPGIDLLGTVDAKQWSRRVPLRAYLQLGYFHDRSENLLADRGCPSGTSTTDCTYSRIVTTAAYDIRQPRVRLAVGAEAPFLMTPTVELGPLVEYHLEAVTGHGDDQTRAALVASRQVPASQIDGRVAQWLTVGARLHMANHLTIDVAFQAGLQSPGFALGSPTPQFAGYGALSWATDLVPRRHHPPSSAAGAPGGPALGQPPSPYAQSVWPATSGPAPVQLTQGRVRGVVRDSKTGQPIAGVAVRFPGRHVNGILTDDRGEYETYYLPPGPLIIESSHGDYEKRRTEVVVVPSHTVQEDLSLVMMAETPVRYRVDVLDEKGQPIPATVAFTRPGATPGAEPQRIEAPPDIAGGFLAELVPGGWRVHIDSDGYLSLEEPLAVTSASSKQKLTVALRHRPANPSVKLGPDHLMLKSTVIFLPNTADLTPQSILLLDEVADLLLRHPELHRIRVEGHTDNVGKPAVNQQLSQERAAAVREYLIKQGVPPDRLIAQGYGATQPLVPNLTPSNRLKNRRVDFKIIERAPIKTP